MTCKTVEKLRDPEYRNAFVASQINIGVPFQIRALLKARGKTQEWLAKQTGMLQPRISGLMSPGRTRPNIETLRRIAKAFDCGLAVRFVPFTELAEWSEEFDPETFNVPDFDSEMSAAAESPGGRKGESAYEDPYRIYTSNLMPLGSLANTYLNDMNFSLRPYGTTGPVTAFDYLSGFAAAGEAKTEVAEPQEPPQLAPVIDIALYRTAPAKEMPLYVGTARTA